MGQPDRARAGVPAAGQRSDGRGQRPAGGGHRAGERNPPGETRQSEPGAGEEDVRRDSPTVHPGALEIAIDFPGLAPCSPDNRVQEGQDTVMPIVVSPLVQTDPGLVGYFAVFFKL